MKTLPASAKATHAGLAIAVSRLTCSLVLLLFAATTQQFHFLEPGPIGLAAATYTAVAGLALLVALTNWVADFHLSAFFLVLDMAAFAALALAEPFAASAVTLAVTLCLLVHILLGASIRWRPGMAIAAAVFLNSVWIAGLVLAERPNGMLHLPELVRWCLFIALVTLVAIWAGAKVQIRPLPRFLGFSPLPSLAAETSVLRYAMLVTNASGATLCWVDAHDRGVYACTLTSPGSDPHPVKLGLGASEGFGQSVPMLFDAPGDRAIVPDRGAPTMKRASSMPAHGLVRELGLSQGMFIPITCSETPSCLMLTGIPLFGWGHCHLAEALAAEIEQGLSLQLSARRDLETAMGKLRQAISHDLHDCVAHALAGARYLLAGLRGKVAGNPDVVREIDHIRHALSEEYLQVRQVIGQLRDTGSGVVVRNLVEDIEALAASLASHWTIAADLVESDFRVPVPVWLSLEIQQIVREGISNAVRHGQASQVHVKCRLRSGNILIEIVDNGNGFPAPEAPTTPRSIAERVREHSGSLDIRSRPGSTALSLSIPIAQPN